MSQHSLLQRAIGAIGRAVAPVIFDPKRRGQFSFKSPISPEVADLAARANIVASQIQERFARETIEVLQAGSQLGDQLTDILGTVRINQEVQTINQVQEILDLPLQAIVEAMVKTLTVLADTNEVVIAAAKKRRRERGTSN